MNTKKMLFTKKILKKCCWMQLNVWKTEDCSDSEKETPEESLGSDMHDKSSHGNVITAYLNEIKTWPVVSRDKEMDLAIAYAEADKKKRALIRQWALVFLRL